MPTPLMNLPEIAENQSAKYLTHNEALNQLEGFSRILDQDLVAPPGSPSDGDTYFIDDDGAAATGAWTGFEGYLAHYVNTSWYFALPWNGLNMWIVDEDKHVVWDDTQAVGSRWVTIGGLGTVDSGTNVGGFSEVFKGPNLSVLEFRTLQSSDSSLTLTQNTNDVDIVIPEAAVKQHYFPTATLVDATNIAWDLSTAQVAKVTLTASRTLDNPTNMQDGATYILRVIQDGVGGHTLTYDTAYDFGAAGAPTLSAGANKVDILTFHCDGTNMFAVASIGFN